MQVNLWGLDAIKTKGESVAIVLYLVGARPLREATGRVARYELIPLEVHILQCEGVLQYPTHIPRFTMFTMLDTLLFTMFTITMFTTLDFNLAVFEACSQEIATDVLSLGR